MSTLAMKPARAAAPAFSLHRLTVSLFSAVLLALILYVAARGFSYYRLPLTERPFHALHQQLRPAGQTGMRLGILAGIMFVAIYVYPLRKRWRWLSRIGSTRHWLDFHIVMGVTAPLLVTLHSAFKFQGLAGMAYWIMIAVVLSGIAGRYLYAQIPRSKSAAELTFAELEQMRAELSEELRRQTRLSEGELQPLLITAGRDEARRMSLWRVLWQMLTLDLRRPFQMAALRRRALTSAERWMTLGGLLASSHKDLERTVAVARRQSWLTAKICFLDRAGEVFELWHVVHRPFSYAFLVLALAHVGMVTLLGYF